MLPSFLSYSVILTVLQILQTDNSIQDSSLLYGLFSEQFLRFSRTKLKTSISNDLLINLTQKISQSVLKVVISEVFTADITSGISTNNLFLPQNQCRVSIIVHSHQKTEHVTYSGVCYITHTDCLHFLYSNLNMI